MKKLHTIFVFLAFLICISCASSNTSKKRCKGVGSWEGKRNLGYHAPEYNLKPIVNIEKKNNI